MKGWAILSHGLESGPQATKVSALAAVAADLGWQTLRPDYRDLDAYGLADAAAPRLQRLLDAIDAIPAGQRVVLAGSSFGAFVSGLAACERAVAAAYLLATPLRLPGYPRSLALPAGLPAALLHGWDDEVCPVTDVLAFARRERCTLTVVADTHRLERHVDLAAHQFGLLLEQAGA
jgi:alpha/beta superfamily hydrolase